MLIKVNVDLCLGFISCPLNVLRKDRYNKKLKKYYVVYEENDTELSEDEERHERKDAEAPCFPLVRPPHTGPTAFRSAFAVASGGSRWRRLGQPKLGSDSEDDGDSDKESKAVQVHTAAKDRLWVKQLDLYKFVQHI